MKCKLEEAIFDENSGVASSFADSRMGLHSLRTARFDGSSSIENLKHNSYSILAVYA